MKGFKQCEKGHFYKEELDSCNYCPNPGVSAAISGGDKTQIFGTQNISEPEKTILGTGSNNQWSPEPKRDLSKTFIQGAENTDSPGNSNQPTRKIAGWIISYTLDPMGLDFRIYEGSNTIGRDHSNTITILKDQAISGKHVTILCKKGQFFLKDEMASNGTFINGTEIEIGKPYDLNDGDEIRLGATTTFKFKSAV
ncbi:MAG: FHA domain-containing protein [Chitinophagaceae bacterium]